MKSIKKMLILVAVMLFTIPFAWVAMAAQPLDTDRASVTVKDLNDEALLSDEALVVGSDGRQIEGVDYLTIKEVSAYSAVQKSAYEKLCDKAEKIAGNGTDYSKIEIVTNEEARPELRYYLPMKKILSMASETMDMESDKAASEEESLPSDQSFDRVSFFRDQLDSRMQVYFDASLEAAKAQKKKFNTGTATEDENEIFGAFSVAYVACPELFEWVDWGSYSFSSIYYDDSDYEYSGLCAPKSRYYSKSLENKAHKKINSLVKQAESYARQNYPDNIQLGIVDFFDNWICENNYYNMAGTKEKKAKTAAFYYCHSSYGCLLKGYGVCESYARAMSRLLDAAEIDNFFVIGDAGESWDLGGHAWNYVEFDGEWYMLDSTWNDPDGKKKGTRSSKEYFLVTSQYDHIPMIKCFVDIIYGEYPALSTSDYPGCEHPVIGGSDWDDWDDWDDWEDWGYWKYSEPAA